ncbi:MAG: dTDP-4-dehydrorhamnose 3,5-epimerase [Gammaproteobacteria bacterium]|nr:dTDP-4-dehydrorhamnose 3,5-epimerase [Gammaproteobacteria bacterium]
MNFEPQAIADVLLIRPGLHSDERGYFFEVHREDKLSAACGYPVRFVQGNESSSPRGVLRGLHFQSEPRAQAKLVRVFEGEILDVAVDIRHGSPHYGRHVAVRLDAGSKEQLFVPRGFAHGFVVLSEHAVVNYLVDEYYSAEHNQGICWNDAVLGIDWTLPAGELVINARDAAWPALDEQSPWFQFSPSSS